MFNKCAIKLTIEDIQEVENLIHLNFPKDFIDHYLKYNGGVPPRTYFYMEEYETFVEISSFKSIKYKSDSEDPRIEDTYQNLSIEKNIIPKNMLPFAMDWGGNLFCMNVETEDIYIIYLDLGEVNESNGSIRFLINGFSNFLDNLEENGDE
ncbi:SMI1 / KNR4 family (SUKH-1) [Apibacter mensalis]|uniref:SMI1 / KNR4 family (SUKH-1) n=1 Tax=Apibacter mensalis TaxID=1586267 RepID=A0A0X3AQ65_9FLAO|nr:SMI1/KNR4 family protein [Apibacter mensalis]CVK17269.1 SMI1 / KNR4 family (SUKH-1) [Apibacter mensalis]